MAEPKDAVGALQDDELYKLLVAGKATPEDQQFAAKWIETLSAFLPDGAYEKIRDGYKSPADHAFHQSKSE